MPGRVLFQQRGGASADLVHYFDLPGGVMQERDRCRLDEQIVVIGGAPEERGCPGYGVAALEADSLDEDPLAGFKVGRAQHDVAELAGPDAILAQDGLGPGGP